MDTPFDDRNWRPTRRRTRPGPTDIREPVRALNDQTQQLVLHPYDPRTWLARAQTLVELQYPELGVGDAYKARRLCEEAVKQLTTHADRRLGYKFGFYMLDENAPQQDAKQKVFSGSFDEGEESTRQRERREVREKLIRLEADADEVIRRNLCYWPEWDEGRYVPQSYPWLSERHRCRDEELLGRLNDEFMANGQRDRNGRTYCEVKRHAFGEDADREGGQDVLGVFAACGIESGARILVDSARAWGRNGPGEGGSRANLYGGPGCLDMLHPNQGTGDVALDLRWVRDRAGTHAADILLLIRQLLLCIEDGVDPLDHHLVARLTPTYHRREYSYFSLGRDIEMPYQALQEAGVDIFADQAFDTWVLFTLRARLDNNACTNPIASFVYPLFSLFNHSCRPNVHWTCNGSHSTVVMEATRDIAKGEQLFVLYDQFLADEPVRTRRKTLRRWLDGDCQCDRCVEEEQQAEKEVEGEAGAWDQDVKSILPEDRFVC